MMRGLYGAAGLGLGLGLVLAMAVVLPDDGRWGVILLGRVAGEGLSLTFQVALWLMLGLGVGDALHRRRAARAEGALIGAGLLPEDDRTVVSEPTDVRALLARCREAPATHLTELIERCLLQFQSTGSTAESHQLLVSMTDLRMHRVELDYSLLRYLGWLIPTVGFIGTVYGIAEALRALSPSDGGLAVEAVVAPLSTAFYSTFVALVASAVLMLVVQRVQRLEEQAINQSARYCLDHLVNRLYAPRSP